MSKKASLQVLENLKANFPKLKTLRYADWDARNNVREFLEEEGEGFKLEGNGFGAYLEDGENVHYIHFGDDANEYIFLEKIEEYPVMYEGTDKINYNRLIYKSENGFYANYNRNENFYFDFDNYPDVIVDDWNS
jgi:hypothetical protein